MAMSVVGTGPKCSRGQRSGAVSVWPGGMRAGSTRSGRRLFLKRKAMFREYRNRPARPGCSAVNGILAFPQIAWARSSVGRARESHSRGQGFESPRVHLSIRHLHIAHRWRQTGEISAEIPALWRQTASSIPADDPAADRVEGQNHQIVALVATPSLDG